MTKTWKERIAEHATAERAPECDAGKFSRLFLPEHMQLHCMSTDKEQKNSPNSFTQKIKNALNQPTNIKTPPAWPH